MFSCFNLQFNTAIVLLKKLENFVAELVLNSDSTWEIKNHALETLKNMRLSPNGLYTHRVFELRLLYIFIFNYYIAVYFERAELS